MKSLLVLCFSSVVAERLEKVHFRLRMDGAANSVYARSMNLFRTIAYAEGISFLLLLGIAMPLKYAWGMPQAVKMMGMAHGVFFLAYIGMVAYLASEEEWPLKKSAWGLLAGFLPFGPFFFHHSLEKSETSR